MDQLTQLAGTIDKVIFKSPETGYAVFVLKLSAHELITVKGYTGQLHQGSRVVVKGNWTSHPKFGKQLDATECVADLPTTADGVEKYLGSGLIKGVGPKLAAKLVAVFGDQTLEVIDKEPSRLLRVDGIGQGKLQAIITGWHDQKEVSRVMLFLRSKDVSTAYATKIYKTYGSVAIEKIQDNPYCLIDDIWGVGFKTADQIALKLGLELHSMARVKAGILHVLAQATDGGHLYVEVQQLKTRALELLELASEHSDLLKQALHELFSGQKIKLLTYENTHYLALPQYYFSERGIAQKVLRLNETRGRLQDANSAEVYQWLRQPDTNGIALNDDQQKGIMSCLQHKVSIITGGPGTGKTTLVKKLIQMLETQHLTFKLAAPTGRAAKRMFESTGKPTETLHRLLEYGPGGAGFGRNEQKALELDVLIIDEASMIDVFLMHAVLKAMPWQATLILLGDVDQLPSVGAGNVLRDLIDSEKVAVVRLTQIFRQAEDSMIVVNAHRVNHGEFPLSPEPGKRRDFAYMKEEEPEKIIPLLRMFYQLRLPKMGISPDDAVVLVPMNRGIVGTQRINQELQEILNPSKGPEQELTHFSTIYRVGDRVMQIRNNYEKFVFNGDMGTITAIDKADQNIMVAFGNQEHTYEMSDLNELVLAYAISIHKSQGSEFKVVIIPIFMQHFVLLQRNLIYTAITRAKNFCLLVGQPKAIGMGIRNAKGSERVTFLRQYLTTDLEAR